MRWCAWQIFAVTVLSASCASVDPDLPCVATAEAVDCPHHSDVLHVGVFGRSVFWKTPTASPPDAGWPAAIVFQGSFFAASTMWHGDSLGDSFGLRFQTETLQSLVEAGFVVITPEAAAAGTTFWQTNVPPFSTDWEHSDDNALMLAVFSSIEAGAFGPIDTARLYATGISSGGYMTSRMAVSYPGRFRALAICAGSYATCAGPICDVPAVLSSDHPPTLFLHGEDDVVVPIGTMSAYRDALSAAGIETDSLVDAKTGHQWLPEAPVRIRDFFVAH